MTPDDDEEHLVLDGKARKQVDRFTRARVVGPVDVGAGEQSGGVGGQLHEGVLLGFPPVRGIEVDLGVVQADDVHDMKVGTHAHSEVRRDTNRRLAGRMGVVPDQQLGGVDCRRDGSRRA